ITERASSATTEAMRIAEQLGQDEATFATLRQDQASTLEARRLAETRCAELQTQLETATHAATECQRLETDARRRLAAASEATTAADARANAAEVALAERVATLNVA